MTFWSAAAVCSEMNGRIARGAGETVTLGDTTGVILITVVGFDVFVVAFAAVVVVVAVVVLIVVVTFDFCVFTSTLTFGSTRTSTAGGTLTTTGLSFTGLSFAFCACATALPHKRAAKMAVYLNIEFAFIMTNFRSKNVISGRWPLTGGPRWR